MAETRAPGLSGLIERVSAVQSACSSEVRLRRGIAA
ncbi:hypothetical protein L286_07225 [Sphingobium sp. HDIP04]|nr:hypothetical protein L286_07225 [Sphingobium sp. HDIP04]